MNIEPITARLEGFGASVVTVNGHDVEQLAAAATAGPPDKPHFVLAYTNTSQGIPLLDERKPHLHFVRFKSDEEIARYQAFLKEIEVQ